MRRLLPGLIIVSVFAALLAGCASNTSAPIVYGANRPAPVTTPRAPVQPPPASSVFLNAPSAPLLGELRVCRGTVSNSGPVDNDGRSMLFSSYIFTPSVVLMRAPIESGCLSSGFGMRDVSTNGENQKQHGGIDLANPSGGFVFAAAAGQVVSVGYRGDYGLTMELDHGGGVHTLYAHLQAVDPRLVEGSQVAAGLAIGRMGRTGNATGVNLHYEVSLYGLKLDPLRYGLPPADPTAVQPSEPTQPAAIAFGGSARSPG